MKRIHFVKLLLVAVLAIGSLNAWGAEVTFTPSDYAGSRGGGVEVSIVGIAVIGAIGVIVIIAVIVAIVAIVAIVVQLVSYIIISKSSRIADR